MKRYGLVHKLIAAVCVICILFTGLFIVLQVSMFKTAFQAQQTEQLEADAQAAQDYIHLYLQQLKNLAVNAALREELKSGDPDQIVATLERFVDQTAESVHFAFFVDADENIFCSNQIVFRVVQITMNYDMPLQIAREMSSGYAVYVSNPYRSSTSTMPAIAFARRVYDAGQYMGTVVLEVDLATACTALQSAANLQRHSFLVVTQMGEKVFGVEKFHPADATIERMLMQQESWKGYQDEHGAYRVYAPNAAVSDWRILLIADESSLYASISAMVVRIALISAALLVTLMLVIIVSVNHFTIPLLRLTEVMNRLDESELALREKLEVDRKDEIGDLSRAFQNLLDRIQQLMRKQHEIERKRTHAEIRALQNQLRPHFLYNTLNTISALALSGQGEKVPSAISALIHLLVMCTDKTEAIVSLADEVQTTRYYLAIMSLRYGDRFDSTIRVPETLEGCAVPKLVLQPLVENAVFHGLHSASHHGMLEVEAYLNEEGHLVLSVLDDGDGIPPEKLAILLTDEGDMHSTGLRNTHSRIQLYFGDQYGLRIQSIPGVGTRVEAVLPCQSIDAVKDMMKEDVK